MNTDHVYIILRQLSVSVFSLFMGNRLIDTLNQSMGFMESIMHKCKVHRDPHSLIYVYQFYENPLA